MTPHGPGGESPETLPALIAIIPQFWPPHGLFERTALTDETIEPPSEIASPFRSWPIHASVKPPAANPAMMQPS